MENEANTAARGELLSPERRRFLSRLSIAVSALAPAYTGAAFRAPDPADATPLIDAARASNTQAVRALLGQRVDVNAKAPDGATALHWASYRDDVQSADLLIRAGGFHAAGSLRVCQTRFSIIFS